MKFAAMHQTRSLHQKCVCNKSYRWGGTNTHFKPGGEGTEGMGEFPLSPPPKNFWLLSWLQLLSGCVTLCFVECLSTL